MQEQGYLSLMHCGRYGTTGDRPALHRRLNAELELAA
jgi:hypothetical protein